MNVEIIAVGGYDEVGRNMTAIRYGDELVLFDMGLNIERYISLTEDEDIIEVSPLKLVKAGAIPDISLLPEGKILAIVPTHAHLDHIGGIPYLADKFSCPIICTPFTGEVLRKICEDKGKSASDKIKPINTNSKIKLSENMTLEFVRITHSTPQAVLAVLHTPEGAVLYANDYKFDLFPVIEKKPNLIRLKELGKEGVLALIIDSLYSSESMKTPSEKIAREMLREVMLALDSKDHAMIVTTFSSHLARLKSIVDFSKELGREPIFFGRSLARYIEAGIEVGIWKEEVQLIKYGAHVRRKLRQIQKEGIDKYVIICTGHQGEPKAVLNRLANGDLEFDFKKEDIVIFSCHVIPTQTNILQRKELEKKLSEKGLRILRDIHVSGHAAREDHRELINMANPIHVIPSHGEEDIRAPMIEFAVQLGFIPKKTVHSLNNGDLISLKKKNI